MAPFGETVNSDTNLDQKKLAPGVKKLLVLLVHPDLDHPLVVDGDYRTLRLLCQIP